MLVVMNRIDESPGGAIAPLSLCQKYSFLVKPQIFNLKCVKCSSDSKYTTFKPT